MTFDKPRKLRSGIFFSKNKCSPKKYPAQNAPAWTELWPNDPNPVKDKLPRIIVGEKFSITMYTKLPLFIVGSPNMVDREVQSFYFVFYDNLEKVRAPIWISIKFVFATAANFMRAVENFSQNLTSSPLARSNQTLQANLSGFITWDFMPIHVPVWKSIDWCIIIA